MKGKGKSNQHSMGASGRTLLERHHPAWCKRRQDSSVARFLPIGLFRTVTNSAVLVSRGPSMQGTVHKGFARILAEDDLKNCQITGEKRG